MKYRNTIFSLLVVGFWTALSGVSPAESVTFSVDTASPGKSVSPELLGLSYETGLLLPNGKGAHYFRPDNEALVTLFRTLGVKSLRIGGNSVDTASFAIPGAGDLQSFFEFAKAADVRVIYSVRLKEVGGGGEAAEGSENRDSAVSIAKLIHDQWAERMDCFAIGNEPSYLKEFSEYQKRWKSIHDGILGVFPEANFCGPDTDPSPEMDAQVVKAFGNAEERLIKVSQHTYPFGCSYKNPKAMADTSKLIPVDAEQGREKMLSPEAYATYQKIYDGMAKAVQGTSVSYCLSETNSFWFSGLKGASDSYASALWVADYLHWWAAHGARNVDLHTGDRTGGEVTLPCRYAAFVTSDGGYEVRPLAYGMKVFDLGGRGQSLPIKMTEGEERGLSAYALITNDHALSITLINKTHGASARPVDVHIVSAAAFSPSGAEVIFMRGKNDDISVGSGDVTLGEAAIQSDGTWAGHWGTLSLSGERELVVTVPPASAAVIKAPLR